MIQLGQTNKRILSDDEIQQLYRAIDTRPYRILVKLTLKHGLRNSEARTLKRKHLQFDQEILSIEESKYCKDRNVPMAQEFTPDLRDYVQDYHYDEYIFGMGRGTPPTISSRTYQKRMRRWSVQAGLYPDGVTVENVTAKIDRRRRITPHTLRHTYATTKLKNDVSIQKVSKLLGHEDVRTTINEYGHLVVEDVRDAQNEVSVG